MLKENEEKEEVKVVGEETMRCVAVMMMVARVEVVCRDGENEAKMKKSKKRRRRFKKRE